MLSALFDRLFKRTPSPERFARLFIAAARKAGYRGELEFEPDEFRVSHDNGSFFNLHNAYHAYNKAGRAERDNVLQGFASTLMSAGATSDLDFEQARPLLRPIVRNRGMLEEIRLHHVHSEGWDKPYPMHYRPFGEDCMVLLAIDQPEATSTLTQGPPEAWGISLDEALAIACTNLRDDTPDAFAEVAPGVFRGAWADAYDTSRVLLPDVLQRVAVRGRPVFMLPTRDVLLVSGDRDEAGLGHMLDLSHEAVNDGRCVSALLYTYENSSITTYEPEQAAHRQRRDDLRRLIEYGNYGMQKQFLEKIHARNGHDIFVASYLLYELEADSGRTFSMCTWTRDVDTSLPHADRLVLVMPRNEEEADTLVVGWEEAISVLGELLEPEHDMFPPRLLTRGFPSAEQLARLTPL
ncbi:DUF1444 domain-containing protein [Phytopseudomonas dryadis]|uniref:DUF1444 domain-containing protein n=1 Tax=Phytopseudomonas dryadis TaxID=2487520 RepID=A0A4Q9RCG3_9GAMM|nr:MULTISPECIES: hypothetical protein [Pseudomonas]TBU97562.1 hypothetical protein DNK44_00830 [Pseudomonas dryadis]TBV10017.1 hypothetical protein DNK34_00840 [Pseudomonas dryadis]TBV19154.1 hypothetical protein DNK41_05405 [Pseudomonas sp. FRB 230]